MIQSDTARLRWLPVTLAAVIGLVLAGTTGLWGYYGTAVFFEMVRTGWAACF